MPHCDSRGFMVLASSPRPTSVRSASGSGIIHLNAMSAWDCTRNRLVTELGRPGKSSKHCSHLKLFTYICCCSGRKEGDIYRPGVEASLRADSRSHSATPRTALLEVMDSMAHDIETGLIPISRDKCGKVDRPHKRAHNECRGKTCHRQNSI